MRKQLVGAGWRIGTFLAIAAALAPAPVIAPPISVSPVNIAPVRAAPLSPLGAAPVLAGPVRMLPGGLTPTLGGITHAPDLRAPAAVVAPGPENSVGSATVTETTGLVSAPSQPVNEDVRPPQRIEASWRSQSSSGQPPKPAKGGDSNADAGSNWWIWLLVVLALGYLLGRRRARA